MMPVFTHSTNANRLPFNSVVAHIKNLQTKSPLVHRITNTMVQNFTANILLAVGASPAMIIAEEEIPYFIPIVDVLLINVGTITSSTAKSMLLAVKEANNKVPWVLDPVAVASNNNYMSSVASDCSLMERASEESYSDNGLGTFSVSLLDYLSQPIKLSNAC